MSGYIPSDDLFTDQSKKTAFTFDPTYMSELFSQVASHPIIDFIEETGFNANIECTFLLEYQLFSLQFLSFVYKFVFFQYINTIKCSFMLNLSVSNRCYFHNSSTSNRFLHVSYVLYFTQSTKITFDPRQHCNVYRMLLLAWCSVWDHVPTSLTDCASYNGLQSRSVRTRCVS